MEVPAYLLALRAYYQLHPVFKYIPPTEAVLIEHPHVAETDATRLAYSRSSKDGEDFLINGHRRQTLTSVTKYLKRHYPDIKDSDIFKLSQQHDEFLFMTDMKEIIHAVETGPSSCMKSASVNCGHKFDSTQHRVMLAWLNDNTRPEPDWDLHPYSAYSLLGWSLAIHKGPSPVNGEHAIIGRALVYKTTFVRSFYQASTIDGYSLADTALESWLYSQGIEKAGAWPHRTPIALIDGRDGPLLPYIDGNSNHVIVGTKECYIVEEGELKCDNTNGTGDEVEDEDEEPIGCCDDCGDSIYDGDECNLIRDGDDCVCDSCLSEYTYAKAYVRNRTISWNVPDDEVVYVDGVAWDSENLSGEIVQLENGDYANLDDTVTVDDEYYLPDDSRVCEIEGEYYLKEDCWQDVDGAYHTPDEEFAMVDGCRYATDDDRIIETAEGSYCLVEESWEDVDGEVHHTDVQSYELDSKLFTAAQLAELHKGQLLLEFA